MCLRPRARSGRFCWGSYMVFECRWMGLLGRRRQAGRAEFVNATVRSRAGRLKMGIPPANGYLSEIPLSSTDAAAGAASLVTSDDCRSCA